MGTRRIRSSFLNGIVLMVIVLGALPAAPATLARAAPSPDTPLPPPTSTTVLRLPRSQAPTESAPAESAPAARVEEQGTDQPAALSGPAVPQSPDTCSAPAKVPFGQDMELLMGPMWTHNSYRMDQSIVWSSMTKVSRTGTLTTSVTGCTSSGPLPEAVYLYENSNYGGGCYILGPGEYANGSRMGVHDDHLSSLKVGSNVKVTIYENSNYGGGNATFASNVSSMGDTSIHNDHASSAKVWLEPRAYGNVAAAAWGTDRNLVLMKTDSASGELAHIGWDAASGWGDLERRGQSGSGNPVVVARGFDMSYFVRSGSNIKFAMSNAGVWTAWDNIPGIADAASDPAVIATDIYHLKLFYRKSDGTVKFTEYESGVGWRSTPLSLGIPASSGGISSELSAVARDENHIAVFGVSANNTLWVKEWSNTMQSDWSDTTWQSLLTSVKIAKPGVASRFTGHIGVAVLNTSNVVIYKEWNKSWKAAVTIGGYVEPVGLVATAGDEMFMYGVNASGYFYAKRWTTAGGWEGWTYGEAGWAAGQLVAAVVGRPHNLMLVGRNSANEVVYKRYTNQGQGISASMLSNPTYGVVRGQTVATVNGRTNWVSAWRGSEGYWIMAARDAATWTGGSIFLSNPVPSSDVGRVGIAAADLDGDGNDEVVLGTLDNDTGSSATVGIYKLTTSGTGVTAITRVTYYQITYGSQRTNLQVAIGDLDADGTREVVVGALAPAYKTVSLSVFETTGTSLTLAVHEAKTVSSAYQVQDFEMTVGQIDSTAGEQVVLGISTVVIASFLQAKIITFYYDKDNATLGNAIYSVVASPGSGAVGANSTAIAAGDMDSDGIDEVIYTFGRYIYAADFPPPGGFIAGSLVIVGPNDANRTLAVGDLDGDGRAEIVYSTDSGMGATGGWMGILKKVHPWAPTLTWYGTASVRGVPLLADLDGDSPVATFKRCDTVSDVHVLGVVNSQPVWYQNGQSLQMSGGGMANSSSYTSAKEDGWETKFGGSVSVGFEQEVSVIVKIGEVSAKVTQEFMGSVGKSTSHETSTSEGRGMGFGSQAFGKGAVCYTQTSYNCSSYEVAKPGTTYTTTSQVCIPVPTTGQAAQTCSSLENWDSTSFRNTAGSSWVAVGHHLPNTTTVDVSLNTVGNYPILTKPPVDPFRIWWQNTTGFNVIADVNPNSPTTNWTATQGTTDSTSNKHSFEENTEVSAEVNVLGLTAGASASVGYGKEWSTSVGWGTEQEFSGNIYNYPATGCTVCKSYTIRPYVYKAQAKTQAGVVYSYFEQDYYVSYMAPSVDAQQETAATPSSVVGLTPQAPIITSTTHSDPANWYPTSTVVLNWSQPAGDSAVVVGYKWNVDQSPVATPTAMLVMTTTHTYRNLPDGIYYLHIRAVGDAGDLGPITDRAIRVDTNAPQVKFVANPIAPNGFDGWYKTPVTVTVAATDTTGSGVASVEASADGTIWLPYTAPIPITADTSGLTLWARATDSVGHTSDPISTTIKLDKTPPSMVDSDGFGLSYASIITDEVGNAQLVLGGALNDALSGRLQVEVKAGDTGQWHAVSAVGELPLPPGNWFSTTMTSLNWIYTPTFEVRGVYPLWARGVDAAGNVEAAWMIGTFWWEPDSTPVLDETRVSVSPHQAHPGDEVAFTVAARNSGYQEAQMLVTDTVPAGLTVLPESISNAGQYSASTGVITWTLHALWPGQTQYLFFKATADGTTTPVTLTNQVDVMAYWPWEPLPGVPSEPARHFYSATNTLTVLPGASGLVAAAGLAGQTAPRILDAAVVEGEIVNDPQVTMLVNATPDANFLYVKEWTWDDTFNRWSLARESGWVPFEAAAGFQVSQDSAGKYGRYQWVLSEGDGVKYLGIWVADANGQTSNVNEGNLIYTNLVSAGGQQLAAGQVRQYRVKMRADQLAVLSLVSLSGDADLYVWKPRAGFMPNYYSNAAPLGGGLSLDTAAFYAQEEGVYVIEVQTVTDATYRLVTAGDVSSAGLLAETQVSSTLGKLTDSQLAALKAQDEALSNARQTLPRSTHMAADAKARPDHPLTLGTPYGLSGIEQLGTAPNVPPEHRYYMPLVYSH